MKTASGKNRRQPSAGAKAPQPQSLCGTLSYLAECRRAKKDGLRAPRPWQSPGADAVSRIRKHPAYQ